MNVFEREHTEIDEAILQYEDRFLRPQILSDVKNLGSAGQDVTFATQYEHELRLRLFVRFRANQAQYRDALAHAKTQMLHLLYRDALAEISAIRKYAMDGNRELIFEACDRLQKAVGL